MKEANLQSIIASYYKINENLFNSYLSFFPLEIKQEELNDLSTFITILKHFDKTGEVLDGYFVGYKIPQIGKEFDLLRFRGNSVINIEIKKKASADAIIKQLKLNKYYLGFLKKDTLFFTFIADEKKIYTLEVNDSLREVKFEELSKLLVNQKGDRIASINELFVPSNYLVSPLNSTDNFINGSYFLTNHQEQLRKQIIRELQATNYQAITIEGGPGTGKTLLTYHIAKELREAGKDVLVVHCGNLNQGHIRLKDEYKWDVIPTKFLPSTNLEKYHIIIVDEIQRIYQGQFDQIVEWVKKTNRKCIFSYDSQQCLNSKEILRNIPQQIKNTLSHLTCELKNSIRTNREIIHFVDTLIYKGKNAKKYSYTKIELTYFQNSDEALTFLKLKQAEGWKAVNYTGSAYFREPYDLYSINDTDNAHSVIGQEFDNVVVVMDEHFRYINDRLTTRGHPKRPYYHPTKMFYQIATRARNRLCVIIINNKEVLTRALSILTPEKI